MLIQDIAVHTQWRIISVCLGLSSEGNVDIEIEMCRQNVLSAIRDDDKKKSERTKKGSSLANFERNQREAISLSLTRSAIWEQWKFNECFIEQ